VPPPGTIKPIFAAEFSHDQDPKQSLDAADSPGSQPSKAAALMNQPIAGRTEIVVPMPMGLITGGDTGIA
jgi:hypothetical protein